jgi:signal transduction histidine kinase
MTTRRLVTRLVLLAAVQMLVLAAAAIVIWWFTAPQHHHGGGDHALEHLDHALGHGGPHGSPPIVPRGEGPMITLIAGFGVLILGAVLTARWLVRPIEKLSAATRAIGKGDLSARAGVDRKDEIGELGADIDEMAHRIERLVAAERELLANVAHELRTPLSRISVALDLAGEGDAKRARASLEDIAVDVAELDALVTDILTAARFELGKPELPLRRATVEPASIANTAAERLHARHPDRPLELDIAPGLPAIDVDPVLFRRIVDNLLENAHKYTPDAKLPIVLRVSRSGEDVVFEVADRGVGIASEDLPRVFTAFFRGERSRSRETGGVGLGLTLARRIADAHGGCVSITSELDRGTTARLSIPRLT